MAKRRGKVETVTEFTFLGSRITVDSDCSHEIKRCLLLGRKAMTNLDSIVKNRHHFANKDRYGQSYGSSSSYVWMRELDHKECWVLKNWCFQTVVGIKEEEVDKNPRVDAFYILSEILLPSSTGLSYSTFYLVSYDVFTKCCSTFSWESPGRQRDETCPS